MGLIKAALGSFGGVMEFLQPNLSTVHPRVR